MTGSDLTVAHLFKGYPPVRGGIEGHVDLLTRLLVERGVRAHVLCARAPGTAAHDVRGGVAVQRCSSPVTLASTPLPPTLPWALYCDAAQLVHLHLPWPPAEVAYAVGGRQRPLVVTIHCEVVRYPRLSRLLEPLTQRILSRADSILVTGEFMVESPPLRAHRDRTRVVPLGVDLRHFHPEPGGVDPLPAVPHPRVLFVGRLRHYKGLPILAQSLARLPGVQLVVVGDGPERASFEQVLYDGRCRERAHFVGDAGDDVLLRLLQTADAVVLASTTRAEAFGLAAAEAQACGVPAVTTDVGTGTRQTVADGVSGRVVPPNDPVALAEALQWCLDPDAAPIRRVAARAHAEQHLCARRMTAAVHRVYEEILEARG